MMEPFAAAAAVTQVVSNVSKALNSLRETAKASKDVDLKEDIGNLYDEFIELKELILRLRDEIEELKAKEAAKPELRQVGETYHYFDDKDRACCQPCYDKNNKLVVLSPPQRLNNGVRRHCFVCNTNFYEKAMEFTQPAAVRPYSSYS